MFQFTGTEHKEPNNCDVYMLLQNCEFSAWSFMSPSGRLEFKSGS